MAVARDIDLSIYLKAIEINPSRTRNENNDTLSVYKAIENKKSREIF